MLRGGRDFAIRRDGLRERRRVAEAAGLELGTEPAVDALRDAARRDLRLVLRDFVDDKPPRRALRRSPQAPSAPLTAAARPVRTFAAFRPMWYNAHLSFHIRN